MLPRSRRDQRVHPDCPAELHRGVDVAIAAGIAGKPIFAGDKLADLVGRHCPDIVATVAAAGFELRFDMPENTHAALRRGRVAYQIRRPRPQ